jgi:hypothetical protein
MKRQAAIEPAIGPIKLEHRMEPSCLTAQSGPE